MGCACAPRVLPWLRFIPVHFPSNGRTPQGFAEIVKAGNNAKAYAVNLDVRALRGEEAPATPEVNTSGAVHDTLVPSICCSNVLLN